MGKMSDAFGLSTWTTGAGIVIGTNCDVGGIFSGSIATTVTIKAGAAGTATQLVYTGPGVYFCTPVAMSGPITATSSGGTFSIAYRQRPQ